MKELGKSLLLVALTISAVFMTKDIFINDTYQIEVNNDEYEKVDILKIIRPQNYNINFGDSFIKIYLDKENNILDRYNDIFKSFIGDINNFKFEEIDEKTYQQNVVKKSIEANYPFTISLKNLLDSYEFNTNVLPNEIMVSSVLILNDKKDYIYISDVINNKYYELQGDITHIWIDSIYNLLDKDDTSNNQYKILENRFRLLDGQLRDYDLELPNLLWTPTSIPINYSSYKLIKEIDLNQNSSKLSESYAAKIFDDDMEFVKKSVYHDNSIIYMYGYGNKIFKLNPDGSLEYIVKPTNSNDNEGIDFITGLEVSIDKINHIGVPSDTMYLSKYYTLNTPDGIETVYNFNYTKEGIPIYTPQSEDGSVIEVKFLNSEIINIKKYARIITNPIYESIINKLDFLNILTKDDNKLLFDLKYVEDRAKSSIDKKDILAMCLYEMKSIELNYFVDDDGLSEVLLPVWNIVIADTRYFVNIHSGDVLKTEKIKKD